MTKKEIGRCIAFVLVVCIMLLALCEVFELKDTTNMAKRFRTFDKLNENTMDAVWLGTSGVDRYWMSPKAYEEYGMTVFPLAADAMPTWLFVELIEACRQNQDPELFIIDVRAFGQSNDSETTMDVRARRILDSMNFFSADRVKMAFKAMKTIQKVSGEEKAFDLSYLLSYIKYHSMWENEDFSLAANLTRSKHAYMGFYMSKTNSLYAEPLKRFVYDSNYTEELDPISEASLYELLDYAKENNVKLLFVDTPQYKGSTELGRGNAVYRILDEYGVDYINYCVTDEEGNYVYFPELDFDKDFYNEGHVNYYGAEKFTEVVAAHLNETYHFPDHRKDPSVAKQWDGTYKKVKEKIASWESNP